MGWLKGKEKIVREDILATERLVLNYKNLFSLILSVVLAIFILKSSFIRNSIFSLGALGYLGMFISGMFFSYGLTTAPATSMLYLLSNNLNPFLAALIGMVGAVISDYLIFRFVKYHLFDEIKNLSEKIKFHPQLNKKYIRILKTLAPFIAGIIIASPLPDELAASILGSIQFKDYQFIQLSALSNFIGILIIALI